ncbi:MAG TPA: hypothetical protein VFL14_02760 [Xanthomonadales bacterium]|nr:hypothetical protein [Xanthomonadales bacterium]
MQRRHGGIAVHALALPLSAPRGAIAPYLATAGAVAALAAWILAAPGPNGLFSDSIDYLVYAEFFRGGSAGDANAARLLQAYFAETRFPPGYPALLALVGASFANPAPALPFAAACWLLGGIAMIAWVRRLGAGVGLATAIGLAYAAGPQRFFSMLTPHSESVFVPALVGLLATREAAWSRTTGLVAWCLAVGLMPLVRAPAIALVLAALVGLALLRERSRGPRVAAALALLAPSIAWAALRATLKVSGGYGESLADLLADPAAFAHSTLVNLANLAPAIGASLLQGPVWLRAVLGAALAFAAIAWFARSWREDPVAPLFCILYAGIFVVWPFPAEADRLAMPLAAVGLVAIAGTMQRARPLAQGSVALVVVVVATFSLAQLALRMRVSVPNDQLAYQRTQMYFDAPSGEAARTIARLIKVNVDSMRLTPDIVAPGSCVYTKFHAFLYEQTRGRLRTRPFPDDLSAAGATCRYALVTRMTAAQDADPPFWPLDRIEARTRRVAAAPGEQPGSFDALLLEFVR